MRGATHCLVPQRGVEGISTHAPLAGRDKRRAVVAVNLKSISTHAPLAGRDLRSARAALAAGRDFNPRAPCGARRDLTADLARAVEYFNPRAPCGARRFGHNYFIVASLHFNPRAPCGARPRGDHGAAGEPGISTHAPLAGRDNTVCRCNGKVIGISTHAPLAGRDVELYDVARVQVGISTHAPLAGRDDLRSATLSVTYISTHAPLAGRDCLNGTLLLSFRISTHAPLAGRDQGGPPMAKKNRHFNPRAPCGARLSCRGGGAALQ